MHRHNHPGSWKQLPLAFNLNADPESMSVLRAAYSRLKLSRRLTFEQVMSDRALAIGIRHLAESIAHRQDWGIPVMGAPAASGIAEDMDPAPELRPEIGCSDTDRGDR